MQAQGYLISNEMVIGVATAVGSAIGILFRMLISQKDSEIKILREERDRYRDAWAAAITTAERSATAAEQATSAVSQAGRRRAS